MKSRDRFPSNGWNGRQSEKKMDGSCEYIRMYERKGRAVPNARINEKLSRGRQATRLLKLVSTVY